LKGSLNEAVGHVSQDEGIHRTFIIGGASIYRESLPIVDRVLLTRIVSPAFEECDVFMPDFLADTGANWQRAPHTELQDWVGFDVPEAEQEEKEIKYEFQMWVRGQL